MDLKTATFRLNIKARGDGENCGDVDYTITEVVTETTTGIRVEQRVSDHCEGRRVAQGARTSHPGVTLDMARKYRLAHGYQEVTS